MTADRWLRIKDLFDAAVGLPPPERETFLEGACAGDDGLRLEVASLVASYHRSGDFLETPTIRAGSGAPGELTGTRIGPYDVGPRIGIGGMGEVYRARDTRLNRTVAIKVRAGRLSDRALREQFTHEARAFSALNHPRICHLHDVGEHESLEYLVMEYVDGEPIDVHCERRGLGVRKRLQLFRTVCEAVHYAHQNLIVHRDLKPGNILVGSDGEPKLLDFGVAKLLAAVDGDPAAPTLTPALTPEYASPEQVRGEPVTTASDVYSLGVVLYELLSGCRPYTMRSASLQDIVNAVCERVPLPPSDAVREQGRNPAMAARAARELRGDLDTIALKALRKEPARRYLSAQELSDDIGRHLEGRPVAARGDALSYRLRKFVSRHRAGAVVAAMVATSLVVAMTLIVRQSRIAEAERQRAERRFADVRRLAGSFVFEFYDAIEHLPGATRARELAVKRALEYLDRLAQEANDDAGLQAELARAYQRVADVQGGWREANLGDAAGAMASYRKALALQEPLAAAQPADRALQRDLARTALGLGDLQLAMRDVKGALENYRRAVSHVETAAAGAPNDREAARDLGVALRRAADALTQLGDGAGAEAALDRAVAVLTPLAADERDAASRQALARCYKARGSLRAMQQRHPEALTMLHEALRITEALAARDPLSTSVRNELAMSRLEVGRAQLRVGALAAALDSLRGAESITASLAAADPSNVQARWLHGLELNLIAVTLREMRRHPAAIDTHLRALSLLESVARADTGNESYKYAVANTYQLIGDASAAAAARAPARDATRAWRETREWYRRSAAAFDAMRARGTLTGAVVKDADHVAAELARSERELQAASLRAGAALTGTDRR